MNQYKRVKKYIKTLMQVLVFSGILLLGYHSLDYLMTDDTASMTRITFHEFYETSDIDTLLLGPSHVFKGINAGTLTENTEWNVFNLSTSSQSLKSSYYLLLEALRTNEIQRVYLEISPAKLAYKEEKINTTSVYIISDYLKPSFLKCSYLFDEVATENLFQAFFRVRRNFDSLHMYDIPWGNLEKKDTDTYKNYDPDEEIYAYQYLGRGSWSNEISLEADNLFVSSEESALDNVSVAQIDAAKLETLEKIVRLCKKNEITLTLLAMPYPEIYLQHFVNYDEFFGYMKQFAAENNLGWVDLNLVKDHYLNLEDLDFSDYDHLNISGNKKTTDFFLKYLKDPENRYFYDSLEEKWMYEPLKKRIMAIEYESFFTGKDLQRLEPEEGMIFEYEWIQYYIRAVKEKIGGVYYQVSFCELDEKQEQVVSKKIIEQEQVEDGRIGFRIHESESDRPFMVEVFDAQTDERLYCAYRGMEGVLE